ncbi:CDP-diacylglycerol--glycerol-3-phosphate 3-phosphatidyltransferase [Pseudoalteromonas sp. GCY]|uniref:CDP-alcohol phosphatidyltransferase family protein n=1 Tax=Pseudoalteromonas maricaloris TaxID=184924 RepID=A0A8I2GZC3_9GAMM|nr:CDP-alcohol phosphatidyltransferase family protein [Pseudoalteromonas maricaloris]PHI35538.1 CDP-diacylglycerol--glycerol-3-phosphate 3-phosphatidyltransferase [Pseudoalteromonas sp. GCY]RZG15366.1 CDP-alcohol phosphatidyltransferase family protein [Pseudoalteromonas sp. CO342X]
MVEDKSSRRPLKVRSSTYAQRVAKWLSNKNITPNTISLLSVLFAACSAICLVLLPLSSGPLIWLLPLLAATCIQFRLLCNLFDGMVAMEGGKSTASGELFNDMPDRFADAFVIVAVGYALPQFSYAVDIAWCAAILAIMTAYVRTLATSTGAPANFCGPMAKQHRMALLTFACIFTAIEPLFWQQGAVLYTSLLIISVGSFITVCKRAILAYQYLEDKHDV